MFLETTCAVQVSQTLVSHGLWLEGREGWAIVLWSAVSKTRWCLLRLPQNPVMNSPVVSVAVFHGRNFLRGVLVSPINLEFRLLQTANRSKAICVQWDPPGP